MSTTDTISNRKVILKTRHAEKYVILLFVFLWVVACAPEKKSQEQIKSDIIALAKKRSAAVVNSDTTTLGAILSKDFYYINIYGELLSREKYLGNNSSLGSDSSRWISQDIDSVDVQVLDNSAVITFRVLDKFIYEGEPYKNYCRSTFVYSKENNEWRCLLGHTTKIETEE